MRESGIQSYHVLSRVVLASWHLVVLVDAEQKCRLFFLVPLVNAEYKSGLSFFCLSGGRRAEVWPVLVLSLWWTQSRSVACSSLSLWWTPVTSSVVV